MRVGEYLSQYPRELLGTSMGRRIASRDDPLLFAILYFPHHLRFGDDEPSLSQFHLDLADYAKSWLDGVNTNRDCFIAPRQSGKTTWLFLLLPMWAAAHRHLSFIAAFSDSASQATQHLQTFKKEIDSNELLRKDYPELCKPLMGGAVKRYVAQSNEEIQQSNGFSFMAKGIDSKSLGMKIGNTRPQLILLDDIEPSESNYSPHEAKKRLRTILDGVFYLNDKARIVIIGTTTMSNSIIDQIRKVGELQAERIEPLTVQTNMTINTDTDNSYYVNLGKGNLTNDNAGNGLYTADRANEHASGFPTPTSTQQGHTGESEASFTTDEIGRTTQNIDGLSNSGGQDQGNQIVTECSSLARFAKPRLDKDSAECLTSAGESEFKLFASFSGTSIPTSHIEQPENGKATFTHREQSELAKLIDPVEPNRGEREIESIRAESSLSFYDSLDSDLRWVIDERIRVHYYPAIVIDADGIESSWWPEFKTFEELDRIRHTRAFQMNYQNRPVNVDAQYWVESDIEITECAEGYKRTLLSVDPAVSTKTTNDYTALVVVSLGLDDLVYIRHAEQVRLVSTDLRDRVNELIDRFDIGLVYCETNQGGMLWKSVFDGIKAKYRAVHQTEPKTIRAGRALDHYRKHKVRHTRHFDQLEEQMYSFPKVAHDDLVDALGTGIEYFLSQSIVPRVRKRSYI